MTPDLRYPVGPLTPTAPFTATDRAAALTVIAEAPARLRLAVAGLTDGQLDTPYRPGGWTVRQVVHHVFDSHVNAYLRTKFALSDDGTTIKPYPEAVWAEMTDSRTAPVTLSLTLLDALHERWLIVLRIRRTGTVAAHDRPSRTRADDARRRPGDVRMALAAPYRAHHRAARAPRLVAGPRRSVRIVARGANRPGVLGLVRGLFPYLAIADELRARGHTPVVTSCPYYQGLVEREGFAFRPLRPDVRPDDTTLIQHVMDARRGSEVIIRELVVPALRDSFADIAAAAEGADLVVSHPITFAAPLVAERRGLPWMATVLAPLSFFSLHDFPALPNAPQIVRLTRLTPWAGRALMAMARRITRPWVAPVVALRAEFGLPPAGDPLYEGQFSPHGNLALFSRAFGEVQPDWPARTTVTGFPFFNRAIQMPPALTAFLEAGDPPIVFTLGSAAVNTAGTFYQESAAAMAALGGRAVLLVGPQPRNVPAGLAPTVMAVESAPHDQLFPRASIVVHQGGVGTTGQAIRGGRPQLVVPFAHDQPDNAFRVEQLGIGRVVYPKRYQAQRVARELRTLLDGRDYASRADAVGRQVRAEGGAAAAVDAMLAVLARR